MAERGDQAPASGGSRGFSLARLVTLVLVVLALGIATLVAVAVLNPQPEKHRVDYGGFQQ